MIIPVTLKSARSNATHLPPQLARLGSDEVVLIELQGSLTVETNEVEDRDGQAVGTLHIDEIKPTLHIGHHLLEGKIATLAKPLAVLHRHYEDRPSAAAPRQGWDVVAVVRRKIVFSKRPMPVVGHGDVQTLGGVNA